MSELRSGSELVEHAVMADERGFDFVSISDHIHPWLPEHEHSPFAWSVLGAIATRTEHIHLVTGVTCPIVRYHPVIVAQAAATVAAMSDGRFTLGLGAGERLNEHVTGLDFPAVDLRQEMLGEAIDIMRELWTGEFVTIRGRFFDADHVKIYEHHGTRIPVVLAVSGPDGIRTATDHGCDGVMSTEPAADLVDAWTTAGGDAESTWTEVPLAWEPTEARGLETARRFRFGIQGWNVASELMNPAHFAAATQFMTDEQIGRQIPHGPDPETYVDAIRGYHDAGFRKLAVVPIGDDIEGTLDFWAEQVVPALGDLAPDAVAHPAST